MYADLRAGVLKLLNVAPERLGEAFLDRIRRVKISLLAIDEAHCISEWAHNFRPEYLRLARVAEELALRAVHALTAATSDVARDICTGVRHRASALCANFVPPEKSPPARDALRGARKAGGAHEASGQREGPACGGRKPEPSRKSPPACATASAFPKTPPSATRRPSPRTRPSFSRSAKNLLAAPRANPRLRERPRLYHAPPAHLLRRTARRRKLRPLPPLPHRRPRVRVKLPATSIPRFTEADTEEIRALIFEELPSLSTPRQLTRFLCGLTSPATSRAKLTKRPEFARCAAVPFRTVLAQVEACWDEAG